MKFTNFSHKTPHLKGKRHQLDPNLDLKQLVHHATVQYVDRDADGDVDVYDNPKKNTPDENPTNSNFSSSSKKLIDKQKGELKHTKRGMAYENVNKNLEGVNMQAEEERYCPLCDKREGRSECSYGEKAWDKVSVKDGEYSMARSELKTMSDAIKRLQMKVGKGEGNLEAWVQSKITKAADYIDTAADYVAGGEMEESFTINPTAHKVAGKRRKIEALTTSSNPNEANVAKRKLGKTAELPKVKKEEKLVDKILGELQEQDPCWKGYTQVGMKKKAGKPVPNCVPSEGVQKAKGYNKEDVTIEDANGKLYAEVIDLIKPEPMVSPKSTFMANNELDEAMRLQAQTGNVIAVTLSWRAKYYSLKMFFPQAKLPNRKEINAELQKVYPGCNVIHHSISEIQPGQPLIQAFGPRGGSAAKPGPSKKYIKPYGEQVELDHESIEESAAWQKKEGKNPEGGLNAKGVASYRKENPGSKLQTAVTTEPSKLEPGSKDAKRRKSFCARMGGMPGPMKDEKGRPTRKALSLRKWNC